jgi:type 1 fimbria pilin
VVFRILIGVAFAALSFSAIASSASASASASAQANVTLSIRGFVEPSSKCKIMNDNWDPVTLTYSITQSCDGRSASFDLLGDYERGTASVDEVGVDVRIKREDGSLEITRSYPKVVIDSVGAKMIFPEYVRDSLDSFRIITPIFLLYY